MLVKTVLDNIELEAIQPRIVPARSGYMALSPWSAPIRIGVVASTEAEARAEFASALVQCQQILARPFTAREPVGDMRVPWRKSNSSK